VAGTRAAIDVRGGRHPPPLSPEEITHMNRRTSIVATSLVALALFACSTTHDERHAELDAKLEAEICLLADDPLVTSGDAPESAVCACPATVQDDSTADAPLPTETTTADTTDVAPAPPMPSAPTDPGLSPLLHASKDAKACPTGFCKVSDWGKKKIKEIAACIGITCALVGGGEGTVTDAMKNLARAVCQCEASETRKHKESSEDLKKLINQQCVSAGK
jgi:hypothetical protein